MRAWAVRHATRDRHALMDTKQQRLPLLHLELEPSLEHEKELVFVLVAVPVAAHHKSRTQSLDPAAGDAAALIELVGPAPEPVRCTRR